MLLQLNTERYYLDKAKLPGVYELVDDRRIIEAVALRPCQHAMIPHSWHVLIPVVICCCRSNRCCRWFVVVTGLRAKFSDNIFQVVGLVEIYFRLFHLLLQQLKNCEFRQQNG